MLRRTTLRDRFDLFTRPLSVYQRIDLSEMQPKAAHDAAPKARDYRRQSINIVDIRTDCAKPASLLGKKTFFEGDIFLMAMEGKQQTKDTIAARLEGRRRVVIEGVKPEIDCGEFPIQRVVGETVVVEADVFADGHDAVAAQILYRRSIERNWRTLPME